jgi:ATP-dependent RNA helicase DeaD
MNSFEALGLREEILTSLRELAFVEPTPIQAQAIPFILQQASDLIAFAQTGTGKTAAFGLPLLDQIDVTLVDTQALILSPTRELCLQIARDLEIFAQHLPGLQVVPVYGGVDAAKQLQQLRAGAQVVVATPGRALDLIKRKKLKVETITRLVLDEADEMLSMGFKDELDAILANTPAEKQTLLFSATMPAEMMRIAEKYMHDPEQISVGRRNAGADNVQHQYILVQAKDRYEALKRLIDVNPDMYGIVFCRTRNDTREISDRLVKDGYQADALHGDILQQQRDVVMNRFREKGLQLLIATDVAARGLDVNDLTHVINHSLPDDPEVYIHRSGRTGRAGRSGICLSLVHGREKSKLRRIEKTVKRPFEQWHVPSGEEICRKQLFHLIDRMKQATINPDIEAFMPEILDNLAELDREDLIRHLVSLEFTEMLARYKGAIDLNPPASRDRQASSQSKRPPRDRGQAEAFSRIFLKVGRRDRISPKVIIDLVNDTLPNRSVNIGQINIMPNFSLVEIDSQYEEELLTALRDVRHKGRSLEAKRDERRK